MKTNLKIDGFKCFTGETFSLNNLTVLSGSNGSGKSSLIQSILLIRQAIERCSQLNEEKDLYELNSWNKINVPINDDFELALGTWEEIINRHSKNSEIDFWLDNVNFKIDVDDLGIDNNAVIFSLSDSLSEYKNIYKKQFYYLHAERIGPRYSLPSKYKSFDNCGQRGELTAQVYLKKDKSFFKVNAQKCFPTNSSDNFKIQVDEWLSYVIPDTSVQVTPMGELSSQILIRNTKSNVLNTAPNIGFGISYVLPIIITGLIAEKNTVFIIENPEAHLHPKAQSNLGYFLGKIASSGVQIIIETHSEHIINGIRRAIMKFDDLNIDDVTVFFFDGINSENKVNITEIKIEPNGDLNLFPKDFFDQTRQDLFEILMLRKTNE